MENFNSPTIQVTGPFTGETYYIHYLKDPGCWTYKNKRGYGPGVSYKDRQYPSPLAVYQHLQNDDKVLAAQQNNSPLERENYEKLCYKLDAEPRSDKDIKNSYGTRFGVFCWIRHGLKKCIEETLAYRRLKSLDDIKNEDKIVIDEDSLNEIYYGSELIYLESPLYEF